MTERSRQELLYKTGALYEQLIENQDEKRAAKLASVVKKAADEEIYIAFTGHYSAGKSSLLNCLLMENILPTSPIPTSANLVVIRNGEKRVRLHTTDGACAELEGAYHKDKVQQYCKDGEQIETVEIFDRYTEIEPGVAYIDTPGLTQQMRLIFYRRHLFFTRQMRCFTWFTITMSTLRKMYCFLGQSKTAFRMSILSLIKLTDMMRLRHALKITKRKWRRCFVKKEFRRMHSFYVGDGTESPIQSNRYPAKRVKKN